jgi:hypothetical protein
VVEETDVSDRLMILNFNGVSFDLTNKNVSDYIYNIFVSEIKSGRVYFQPNIIDILVDLRD